MIDLDELEYADAVISLPKDAVYAEITVKVMENGELVTLTTKLSPSDIRDTFDLFERTVDGDYPYYTLTEKGRKLLEEMENQT